MNERIRQLLLTAMSQSFNEIDRDGDMDKMYIPHVFAEKFAELLAGLAVECVRGVLRDDESTLSYEDADRVQKAIKQAFGIEGYYTSRS